jgi:hypothetical protein
MFMSVVQFGAGTLARHPTGRASGRPFTWAQPSETVWPELLVSNRPKAGLCVHCGSVGRMMPRG